MNGQYPCPEGFTRFLWFYCIGVTNTKTDWNGAAYACKKYGADLFYAPTDMMALGLSASMDKLNVNKGVYPEYRLLYKFNIPIRFSEKRFKTI